MREAGKVVTVVEEKQGQGYHHKVVDLTSLKLVQVE